MPKRVELIAFIGFLAAISIGFVNQFAFQAVHHDVIAAKIGLPLAFISVIAGLIGCVWSRVNKWQLGIAVLALLTAMAPIFSGLAHGQAFTDKAWVIALATFGAVLSASAADPRWIRTAAFWLFAAVIWVSLILGTHDLFTNGTSTFRNAYQPRYSEWLGLPVLSGITGHQNTMGFICAVALTLQAGLIRRRLITWPDRWTLIAIGPVASVIGLLWSQSRTSLGAAVLGVILVFLPFERARGTRWSVAWGGGIAFIVIAPLIIGFAGITSFTGRTEVWRYAVQDFRANPVFGYGLDFMHSDAYWRTKPHFPDLFGAHNQFLDTAGRSGLVGLVCLVALFVSLVTAAWFVRRADGAVACVVIAVYAVLFTQESLLPIAIDPPDHLRETFFPYLTSLAVIVVGLTLFARQSPSAEQPPAEYPDEQIAEETV